MTTNKATLRLARKAKAIIDRNKPPGPPPQHVFPTSTKHPGRGSPMPPPPDGRWAIPLDLYFYGGTERGDSLDLLDLLSNELANPWETVQDSWGHWVDVNLDTGEVRPSPRRPCPTNIDWSYR